MGAIGARLCRADDVDDEHLMVGVIEEDLSDTEQTFESHSRPRGKLNIVVSPSLSTPMSTTFRPKKRIPFSEKPEDRARASPSIPSTAERRSMRSIPDRPSIRSTPSAASIHSTPSRQTSPHSDVLSQNFPRRHFEKTSSDHIVNQILGKSKPAPRKIGPNHPSEDIIEVKKPIKTESPTAISSFFTTMSKSLSDSGMTIDDFRGVVFEGVFELLNAKELGFNSHITPNLEFCFWPDGEFEIYARTFYDDSEEEKYWLKEKKEYWVYGRMVGKKFLHRITSLPLFEVKNFFEPGYFAQSRYKNSAQFDIAVDVYYRRYQVSKRRAKNRNQRIEISKSGSDKFQFINKRFGLKFSGQSMLFQQEEKPRLLDEASLQKAIGKGVNMHCFDANSAMYSLNPHLLSKAFE